MISKFQECMWKGINSQYIYWIYRLFSSPFKFKKLKEFFLCIRKWCCIVQEIVVVVLYWFVSGESFKRLSPCLKMGTYWWWPNTVSKIHQKSFVSVFYRHVSVVNWVSHLTYIISYINIHSEEKNIMSIGLPRNLLWFAWDKQFDKKTLTFTANETFLTILKHCRNFLKVDQLTCKQIWIKNRIF